MSFWQQRFSNNLNKSLMEKERREGYMAELKKAEEEIEAELRAQMAGKKFDGGKPVFDLLPFDALAEVHAIMEFGAEKYGARNWEKGFKWLRLANAAARHLFAWMRGEKCDPETNRSHIAHLACCALFLLTHEIRGLGEDDRR